MNTNNHYRYLHLFEKEKGGVGSTGSLVTAAHAVMKRGDPIVFVECSVTQADVSNAYADRHTVHEVDLKSDDAADQILSAVQQAGPGARIFVNVPGGRLEDLDRVHHLIRYVQKKYPNLMKVAVTWTMGLDAASRTTLDALRASDIPGQLILNMPRWHGDLRDYSNVDRDLLDSVRSEGGIVLKMPGLTSHLYDRFRKDEIGLDMLPQAPRMTFGNVAAFEMWEDEVVATLASIY
ncbi:hypothetical protein SPAN111604_11440 [Sphingomonas antarctica]|uniref:hypothetical protein n=1 Tax=Sphingomonas antarctica TaxID=2040274 RepID=UPI0039EC118D